MRRSRRRGEAEARRSLIRSVVLREAGLAADPGQSAFHVPAGAGAIGKVVDDADDKRDDGGGTRAHESDGGTLAGPAAELVGNEEADAKPKDNLGQSDDAGDGEVFTEFV